MAERLRACTNAPEDLLSLASCSDQGCRARCAQFLPRSSPVLPFPTKASARRERQRKGGEKELWSATWLSEIDGEWGPAWGVGMKKEVRFLISTYYMAGVLPDKGLTKSSTMRL